MAATASCAMAMGRIGQSRPGSGLSRSVAPRCATGATWPQRRRIRFTSSILPKWARRTKSLDALLPVLYLRGVSTGDFQEALAALLGKDAPNLSPAVISRLTAEWQADYDAGRSAISRRGDTSTCGPTGSTCRPGWKTQAECMLVLIGATPEGKKELVGFQVGVRESAQSWRELLVDIKRRGLDDRAGARRRRRRARLLEGDRRGLSEHPPPAVLGPQDRQRAEQGRPLGPGQHERITYKIFRTFRIDGFFIQ